MVSASSRPSNASRPWRADRALQTDRALGTRARPEFAFLAVTLGLGALCGWLLAHGYVNEEALSRYEKILVISGAHPAKLEYLGLVYPHLPTYLVWFVHELPGLGTAAAPYLASALAAGLAVALWFRVQAQSGPIFAWLALVALCVNPVFLWATTTGTDYGLSLLIFFSLGMAMVKISEDPSPQAFLSLSGFLALYFLADERASYVILALFPLVAILAPKTLLERSPLVIYLLIFTPFVMVFLGWAYLNWLYVGSPWYFLHSSDSAFLGAFPDAPFVPWLRDHGGEFWTPLAIAVLMTLAAFPLSLWHLAKSMFSRRKITTAGVLTLVILLATALATFTNFLGHPLEMLCLLEGVTMIALAIDPPRHTRARALALALLVLGAVGGWGAIRWEPTQDMHRWLTALQGGTLAQIHPGQVALGRWLAVHREPTLLDDSLAYPAIVARGDTDGLLLPYSAAYKLAFSRQVPDVAQIVVPDPHRGRGASDAVNERFPGLYDKGLPGFELAYDAMGWRVYRASRNLLASDRDSFRRY